MRYITKEINRAIKSNNLKSHIISLNDIDKLRESLAKQYCDVDTTFGWEHFKQCFCYQNPSAWSVIKNYVKENNCILFFNECDDKNAFLITNGDELQKILEDSFGFEFYLTDRDQSYVICFNHHDVLYGCGAAEKWVEGLKR